MDAEYSKKRLPTIDAHWYNDIAEGMRMAVIGGTCRKANIPGIEVCGKTGTAQNPHGKDHSAFMGFAPYNDPKIAVAVYIENGGFGAVYGVPIGSLVMEKYLCDSISPGRKGMETQMLNAHLAYASKKKGAEVKSRDKKSQKTDSLKTAGNNDIKQEATKPQSETKANGNDSKKE